VIGHMVDGMYGCWMDDRLMDIWVIWWNVVWIDGCLGGRVIVLIVD